jgi:NAD-dependent dihydropyrimidine dehydrogenase PreA subunit
MPETNDDIPAEDAAPEEELAPYMIEAARSARSKCRTCKRKIDKDMLRIGILLEGPYGTGYLWHHLTCAARRRFEDVEAAYENVSWADGVEVPVLSELKKLQEAAEKKKADKKEAPWAERAKSGRSKCKHCEESIPKDSWRLILDREVEFFGQVRTAQVNIHPACVAAELASDECATEVDGFEDLLRDNSKVLSEEDVKEILELIGELY